jgi:hypothetical protein
MPISSFSAPSAIAKPGVCTSSTRPASPYEGQFIYETDTDKTFVWNGSAWVQQFTASLVDAKGDLLVASADDTLARLAVGSNNQVLVADSAATNGVKWAALSGITTAWTAYTPTATASSGSITTGSLTRARYYQVGKLVVGRIEYVITTAGTAAGSYIDFTLPVTAGDYSGGTSIGFGREYLSTGYHLNVWIISTTALRVGIYENSGVIQNSRNIGITFAYEAA